ncbi:hypothetical protein [Chitinophaga rhizosphaerae]|uniref:hypothetical protein n=1 Tax=Chitinophaga rhizosphaerae TaxID=1864947 RepID=UPI000F80D5A7|nr:hypothetical protein [Chitinophaga rhizosphaerae]
MRKISSLAWLLPAAFVFAGCSSKEDDPKPDHPLNGTYEFVSVYLQARTEMSYKLVNDEMKIVSDIEYTSKDNTGMVLIEGNTMTSSGFGYTIVATMNVHSVKNGTAGPVSSVPFTFTMPKSNSAGTFKYIGADSVFFEKGITQIPSTGQEMPAMPNATKYTIVNGDLIFMSEINMSGTVTEQGQVTQKKQTGLAITRLRKL